MTQIIPHFANHLPVRVQFGEGRATELPALLHDLGVTRPLVLLDQDIETFNPAAIKCLAALDEATHLRITRWEKQPGEPTIAMVDAAAEQLRRTEADAVIALGGGSVIDTAKAARLCHQLNCTFGDFLAHDRRYPEPTVPLIAVPTTAGTGSEVSGGSVVTDPDSGRKAGIAHPHLRPQHAVVDPVLTWSMPPKMTANTGIDALAQAIAAVIAKGGCPEFRGTSVAVR